MRATIVKGLLYGVVAVLLWEFGGRTAFRNTLGWPK